MPDTPQSPRHTAQDHRRRPVGTGVRADHPRSGRYRITHRRSKIGSGGLWWRFNLATEHPLTDSQPQTLGRYLEAVRVQAGYSLRRLVRESGLSFSSLYRILNDEVERPSANNLMGLAKALDLNPAEVFAHAGVTTPPPDLDTFLRTQYGLPEQAIAQIHAIIAANTSLEGQRS